MAKNLLFPLLIVLSMKSLSGGLQVFFEGSGTYYLPCPPIKFTQSFSVYIIINNLEKPALYCVIQSPCQTTFGKDIISNISGYYLPFDEDDLNQPRLTTGIKCVYSNDSNVFSFNDDILFVAKPSNVSCEPPRLTTDQNSVTVTCKTTKVFPQASCIYTCVGCQNSSVQGEISYSHSNYTDIFPYYESSCVWSSSLSNFVAGDYSFNVFLYIINSTYNIYGVNNTSISLQLKLPIMSLSSECFNNQNISGGYFKPESTVSCLCYLDKLGYPVGSIKWIDSVGVDVSSFKNSSVAKLMTAPFHGSKTYHCMYESSFKNGNLTILYTVNYAFGPSTCMVGLENPTQTILSKCEANGPNITIVCNVNQSDVSPNMRSMIYVNSMKSQLLNSVMTNGFYRSKYETSLFKAGNYTIMCQAQNLIFSDVNNTCVYSQILQVREPPNLLPNFVVKKRNGYIITFTDIVENEKYTVECSVDGGIPLVSNITVSCGNISGMMQTGNFFTSPVTFTRKMTGQMCTCTAQHVTGCYNQNKSEELSSIKYPSTVTKLSVYGTNVLINGSSVQFFCEADGNPIPKINIIKDGNSISQNNSGNVLSLTKYMYCRDSGIYQCQANNGLINEDIISQNKNVTIYVICPLQYSSTESVPVQYQAKPGDIFTTRFVIYGYPYPDKLTLFKYDFKKKIFVELELSYISENAILSTGQNVLLSFSPGETPYGTVQIFITNLTLVDFTKYMLVIYQNKSQNLNFTFNITYEQEQLSDSDHDSNIGVIVGCVIGGLALVALITAAIAIARRYKISVKCVKKKKAIQRQRINYSDLDVTQPQQGHAYETPQFKSIKVSSVTTNYTNIDIPLKEQVEMPYEKVD